MAISNPESVNLSPYFANIIDLIKQGAQASANPPPTTAQLIGQGFGQGVGTGVSKGIESGIETKQKSKLLQLQSDLELGQKKKLAEFEDNLKKSFTKEQLGALEELKKTLPRDSYLTLIAGGPEAVKEYSQNKFNTLATQRPVPVADKRSSTGYFYGIPTGNGQMNLTLMEAPPPASSNVPAKTETALRKEFESRADKSGFGEVTKAYTNAMTAKNQDKPTVANDYKIIFALAQLQNPRQRLSDQDFKINAQAGGLGDQVQRAYNRIVGGQVLPDDLRTDFLNTIQDSYKSAETNHSQLEDEFKRLATDSGIDPKKVIVEMRPKIPAFYKTADDVKAAFKNGFITIEEAKKILKEKFPDLYK